jgi:hypothetical protein
VSRSSGINKELLFRKACAALAFSGTTREKYHAARRSVIDSVSTIYGNVEDGFSLAKDYLNGTHIKS